MRILLRHVILGATALSVLFATRYKSPDPLPRWFENGILTALEPVSPEWLRDNVRDRGQRGE